MLEHDYGKILVVGVIRLKIVAVLEGEKMVETTSDYWLCVLF